MDLQSNALKIIYAQLELQFGLFRAGSPKYLKYEYTTQSSRPIEIDNSPVAMAIKKSRQMKTNTSTLMLPLEIRELCGQTLSVS